MCVNAGLQILSGAPIGGTWTGAGITNSSGEFDPNVAGVGWVHTLYYSYTDINACSNIDSLVVTVNALPIVSVGNDTTLCNQPVTVQFNGLPSGGYMVAEPILIHLEDLILTGLDCLKMYTLIQIQMDVLIQIQCILM